MMNKYILAIVSVFMALPASAQLFNFNLRTNNQQLIDEAMTDVFVRVEQYYELCDTIKNEHFGRNEKDYFNIVPFIGIQTVKGIVLPSNALRPWSNDNDFAEYKDYYQPLITKTNIITLNSNTTHKHTLPQSAEKTDISKHLTILRDSTTNTGLKIDTIPGKKRGWLIWLSSDSNLSETDSLKFTSIQKDIEVPNDGGYLYIEKPEISETFYGGIYVTPIRTSVGELSFFLTGIIVLVNDEWVISIPFIEKTKENTILTPINGNNDWNKLNSLKKK